MSVFPLSFTSALQKFDSPLWGFHFVVPDDIAEHLVKNNSKRVVCTLFGETDFQCALMARGKGAEPGAAGKYFINLNKKLRSQYRLEIGDKVEASIRPDDSKYGLPMPEEMAELLAQDSEGDHYFHQLTPGKQRSLLFIVGKPKGSEVRLKKAIVVIEHLKVNEGKLDFQRLNQDFKEANRR